MKKKVTSLLLVIVMMLSMVVTAIPAYAADSTSSIVITSDKTEAFPGEEITFTVAIGPATNLSGIEFKLAAPAGLTFKSGALVEGVQSKLGAAMCGFNTSNQKVVIVGGMDYTSAENTDILVVTYTVNEDYTGELTLGVDADSVVFIDPSSDEIPVIVVNTESKVTVVEKPVAATGVTLNKTTISLMSGDKEKLIATLTPANSAAEFTWNSSNNEVATVANDGTVTAVAEGTAVITVKTGNNLTATCNVTVACSHKSTTTSPEVASTCSVQGNSAYTICNDCGKIILGNNEKLPLDKNNHINIKKIAAVAGTCIEPGHAEYVICNDCSTVISGSNAPVAGAHGKFINKVADEYLVSAADCNNSAVYKKSCELCGVASATEIFIGGDPLGHNYSETWCKGDDSHWLECTACGIKNSEETHNFVSGFCSVCGFEDNHKHTLVLVAAVAATCTEDGNKAYYTCSGCDEWFEDANGTVVIENKDSVKVNATGHVWADATCTAAKTCTVCKATEGKALGHDITKLDGKAATCTEAGLTDGEKCSRCDYEVAQKEIPATGHVWADATCTAAKTCTVCNATEGEALGHEITKLDAKAATCAETGLTDGEKCSRCDYEKAQEVIPATGQHIFNEWEIMVNPTCESEGEQHRWCTICRILEKDRLPAIGHKWADATCTAAKTCTVCNATEGEALGHKFGEWVTVKEATYTAEGLAERACACGEKETKTLEKVPYILGDANLDGTVNAADARIILRISAKVDTLEKHNIVLDIVDMNFDGVLNAADARIVLRISAKLQEIPVKK